MTKRFTDIEHDYENAWIKCKDNGLFMIYPIYEDETEMPTLGDLLNGLVEENEQLKSENNMLKFTIGRNEAYIKRLTEISKWHC